MVSPRLHAAAANNNAVGAHPLAVPWVAAGSTAGSATAGFLSMALSPHRNDEPCRRTTSSLHTPSSMRTAATGLTRSTRQHSDISPLHPWCIVTRLECTSHPMVFDHSLPANSVRTRSPSNRIWLQPQPQHNAPSPADPHHAPAHEHHSQHSQAHKRKTHA